MGGEWGEQHTSVVFSHVFVSFVTTSRELTLVQRLRKGILELFYFTFYLLLEVEHIFFCLQALQALCWLSFACFDSFIEMQSTHLKCAVQGRGARPPTPLPCLPRLFPSLWRNLPNKASSKQVTSECDQNALLVTLLATIKFWIPDWGVWVFSLTYWLIQFDLNQITRFCWVLTVRDPVPAKCSQGVIITGPQPKKLTAHGESEAGWVLLSSPLMKK